MRLGLILSAAVLVVLLLAGAVVNRVVSQSFEDVVSGQQVQQVEAAAEAVSGLLEIGGGIGRIGEAERVLNRLARSLNAPVVVMGPGGNPVSRYGPPLPPGTPTQDISASVIVADREVAIIMATVPVQGAGDVDRPFLRLFNAALLVAGLVSVAAIAGVSVWVARRQTKPLQDVAAAANRLGAGDLSARATGGGDRESQELAGAFNSMAGRLEQSEMLRRRAATDMAHDLATPATVLEGQLQAMIDGVVPKSKANLQAAAASAAALGSVIVQMGELASAEAAPLQARPERTQVATVVADAASALDGLYRERGVTLDIAGIGEGLAAWADPAHLGRALRNVLTNAAQHTPSGKTVRVEATSTTGLTDAAPDQPGPDPGHRPGPRHPGRGPASRLRALLPIRPGPHIRRRLGRRRQRQRSGSRRTGRGHRSDHRPRAVGSERRRHLGRAHRSRRHHRAHRPSLGVSSEVAA